ncbi:RagB/SusD family nutrient uptake outer membrane protein [Pontibacter sp. G13]|uniref:RagB/SusD family nutrient uptake outer membrane protein n=1 Tax=Pontibacter sp. G13 TaxID=3074898 RepID=UPI00288BC9AF|nr:RagB/SusD family nutrient uptake outer membrane protein [Pontibacter sp. G13]WNJ16841.1 RagB/SusD family nutrient uptake outer membrane protein [Pontibacter sp. G13]
MKRVFFTACLFASMGLGVQSCKDSLEVLPTDSVDESTAINNATSANAAVTGLYSELQDEDLVIDGFLVMPQMFSDEMDHTGTFPTRAEFGRLAVFPENSTMAAAFSDFYDVVNVANNLIERLPMVDDAAYTEADMNSHLAEARFVRAYCYFILTNYWGDVPLVLAATKADDLGESLQVPNTPQADIYTQILSDLSFAEANIGGNANTRATAASVAALKARTHLYLGNWEEAQAAAEASLAAATSEDIWYLQFTSVDNNSNAFYYYPGALGGRRIVAPSAALINAFEAGDARFAASIDTTTVPGQPFGTKYTDIANGTDPIYFFRAAEMKLIVAEAAAEQGDFATASQYINMVRSDAGLGDITLDATNFEDAILQERFVELAMEGAHRLLDLRRRGKAFEVLSGIGYEEGCDDLWPLPQRDLDRNPNLTQNPCY